MSARHTPGPWSIPHFAREGVNCDCGYVLCESLFGAVANVYVRKDGDELDDNPPRDEAAANAHLIAAAPELAAALADLVARCDGEEGIRADGSNIETAQAHAALAKAGVA